MKIALCFLTIDNLAQAAVWERFLASTGRDRFSLYCHAKFPERVTDAVLRDRLVPRTLSTRHGDVSLVAATQLLFEQAYEDDRQADYFVLLSDSTVPIVPPEQVCAELYTEGGRSLIAYRRPLADSEPARRLASVSKPELFRESFYHHDQWIVLCREHVRVLRGSSYAGMFQQVFAADEHYFLNVLVHLLNVPIREFSNRRTTYVNWDERVRVRRFDQASGKLVQTIHPKTYRQLISQDIETARQSGCWFLRKVHPRCDCRHLFGG